MIKSRFSGAQIVSILKEADAGMKGSDVCASTLSAGRPITRYGGLEATELKRIKELGAYNAKLKKMYAELAMFNEAFKELSKKKL
jgi:putative transposase